MAVYYSTIGDATKGVNMVRVKSALVKGMLIAAFAIIPIGLAALSNSDITPSKIAPKVENAGARFQYGAYAGRPVKVSYGRGYGRSYYGRGGYYYRHPYRPYYNYSSRPYRPYWYYYKW